jgi:hypothetical protein
MKLSLRQSFYLRRSLRVLHGGHHRGITSRGRGGFSPTISPPNPREVHTVPYEYLFHLPSSDQLRPPAQRMARVLGLLPRVLRVTGYGPKFWIRLVPSSGTQLGNPALRTGNSPTSPD